MKTIYNNGDKAIDQLNRIATAELIELEQLIEERKNKIAITKAKKKQKGLKKCPKRISTKM